MDNKKIITYLVIKHFPSTSSWGKTPGQSIVFKELEAEWGKKYLYTSVHFRQDIGINLGMMACLC